MKRVLVAVDGTQASGRSLDTLMNLCGAFKVLPEVVVLAVKPPIPPLGGIGGLDADVGAETLDIQYEQSQSDALRDAHSRLEAQGFAVVERRESGEPAALIAKVAEQTHCDLMFVGGHAMGALGDLILGSVSSRVLHLSRIPVVVTH